MRLFAFGLFAIVLGGASLAWEKPEDAPLSASQVPHDSIPAFAGSMGVAEGGGALALARCRDMPLVVHRVTSTSATGTGSFRAALDAVRSNRYDIIIWPQGGLYATGSDFSYSDLECVEIAGQTAQGGGVTFGPLGNDRLRFNRSKDLSLRYVRMSQLNRLNLYLQGGERIMVDHVTSRWHSAFGGGHNSIALYGNNGTLDLCDPACPMRDISLTYSTVYSCRSAHPTLIQVSSGRTNNLAADSSNVNPTLAKNFLAGPCYRFPNMDALGGRLYNNVVYNWRDRATGAIREVEMDVRESYYKIGPAIGSGAYRRAPIASRSVTFDKSIYLSGLIAEQSGYTRAVDLSDLWEDPDPMIVCNQTGGDCASQGDTVPDRWRRDTPLPDLPWQFMEEMDSTFLATLLADVGASKRLACDGSAVNIRDAVDSLYIAQFWAGTGASSYYDTDTETTPTPASGTACLDTDSDGIPDEWEVLHCGSITGCDAGEKTASGYLMINHYLNGSDPTDPTPWDPGSAPEPPSDVTFGSGLRIYVVPQDTRRLGVGADPVVVPLDEFFRSYRPMGKDSSLVCTQADLGAPLDSLEVEGVMEAWWPSPSIFRATSLRDMCSGS